MSNVKSTINPKEVTISMLQTTIYKTLRLLNRDFTIILPYIIINKGFIY